MKKADKAAWRRADERARELLAQMTLEEKAGQMTQAAYTTVTQAEAEDWARRGIGSFLNVLGDNARHLQELALKTRLGIPLLFGIDAVHG